MDIFLSNQSSRFASHLERLRRKSVVEYNRLQLTKKRTSIVINTKLSFNAIDFRPLFAYQIFPEKIMTHLTEWEHERRSMRKGDTIVQQIFIPPVKLFSQKIICGVRINEIIDEPDRKGFSYETLEGHVEKGVSTFTLEKIGNQLFFVVQTLSVPANLLTKFLAPVFSLPYQAYCTKQALQHVKRNVEAV